METSLEESIEDGGGGVEAAAVGVGRGCVYGVRVTGGVGGLLSADSAVDAARTLAAASRQRVDHRRQVLHRELS